MPYIVVGNNLLHYKTGELIMPYRVVGNKVLHFKDGKWSVKQTCDSHENAVKALGLLQGLKHGTIKKEDVGKK